MLYMKIKFLLIILILSSCKTYISGIKHEVSTSIKHQLNPVLFALQVLTVEIKDQKGYWPENIHQYSDVYGDSVNILFSAFEQIEYIPGNDSLSIFYTLKNDIDDNIFNIEFVDPKLDTDTAQTTFSGNIDLTKANENFNLFEGKMSFYEQGELSYVIHEFQSGVAQYQITSRFSNSRKN